MKRVLVLSFVVVSFSLVDESNARLPLERSPLISQSVNQPQVLEKRRIDPSEIKDPKALEAMIQSGELNNVEIGGVEISETGQTQSPQGNPAQNIRNHNVTPFLQFARQTQPKHRLGAMDAVFDSQAISVQNDPKLIFPKLADVDPNGNVIVPNLTRDDLTSQIDLDLSGVVRKPVKPEAIFDASPVKQINSNVVPLQEYFEQYQASPGFRFPVKPLNSGQSEQAK